MTQREEREPAYEISESTPEWASATGRQSPLVPGGLTPAMRTLRARMGAYALHARYDPRETTRAARGAFLERFARQVDPDGTLAPAERERRAEAAKRAYMTGLALRSARVRGRHPRATSGPLLRDGANVVPEPAADDVY